MFLKERLKFIKDTHREKAPSNKTLAYKNYKHRHLGRWYIKSTLYNRFFN